MSRLNDEWKVGEHGPLEDLGDDLWTVAGEIAMPLGHFPRRMTVVRLEGRRLAVWSAIPLREPEMERLEGRLGFLATIGSAAPFIGLFGTVVGIMTSFQAIAASKNTNLSVVAPGIAEALLATAIGLLAAIPAVIAYNKLSSDAGKLGVRMEGFADEFSAILSRQIDEKVAQRT